MRAVVWILGVALASSAAAQVPGNGQPMNNGGDVLFTYGSPSAGAPVGAALPDPSGDLYWRAHAGWNAMDDVDLVLGAAMEVVEYHEDLYDTDWSTSPSFYVRAHGYALPDPTVPGGSGALMPEFLQHGFTSETIVVLGPSGFGNPCSIVPSLCSGGTCAPAGFVNGYEVVIALGAAPGAGVVLPADGTAASDTAVTWFLPGGMTKVGGSCGAGDYVLQDVHSTDETQADPTGAGVNPWGGFQLAGVATPEPITQMAESHVHFRGSVVRAVASSGPGVEVSDCGGGAANGRNLAVGGGAATLGLELSDNAATVGDLAVLGASLAPLANPGVPLLGGNLLVAPDGLFRGTSAVWQGPMVPSASMGGGALVMSGAQLAVPASAAGAVLHAQGAVFDALTLTVDTTNRIGIRLLP